MGKKASVAATAVAAKVSLPAESASPEDRKIKRELGQDTARALVDAGYMPLDRYVQLYG